MRAYTAATAAFTLRQPAKWVDNVLSHYHIRGVARARQGVSRRLSIEAIVTLSIASTISSTLGTSMAKAIVLAERTEGPDDTIRRIELADGLTLIVDAARCRREVLERLNHAVETVPIRRRGRPPA